MNLRMSHTFQRNGVWYARVDIPVDVRHAFEGKTSIQTSLRTSDATVAAEKAAPFVSDLKRRIAAARKPTMAIPTKGLVDPAMANAAIAQWGRATIDKAYLAHFNGVAEPFSHLSDEAVALSKTRVALQRKRFDEIDGFDDRLVAAMATQGIEIAASHGAVPRLREAFGKAWEALEGHVERFRLGDFTQWSPGGQSAPPAALLPPSEAKPTKAANMPISALLERYIEANRPDPKDDSELRNYTKRLIEFVGDIDIAALSPDDFDRFLTRLRKFPNTKRRDVLRRPFNDIIEKFGGDEAFTPIMRKTIRTKWFGAYNRLFGYAVKLRRLAENPVSPVIPSKRDDEQGKRGEWTPDDIKAMFSTPLYRGASSPDGNRDKPGSLITKDAKYWLPVIALWSGMRLEEIGALKAVEVRKIENIWVFDLTEREAQRGGERRVKNEQSRRLVPVHPRLIAMGFITYAEKQSHWLFPDLPHDEENGRASTRLYTKWFGRWCDANGFPDPDKTFHSFRHYFKRAAREAGVTEEVSDLLTGHKGNGGVGRSYGAGMSLTALDRAMRKVDYPPFPNLS